MRRILPKRMLACVCVAAVVSVLAFNGTGLTSGRFVSVNPSITQRFGAVGTEESLADLCYRLRGVYGVTGVSYRDFSPAERTAMVTVFYDPKLTSKSRLTIYIRHTRVLWQKPMRT